MLPTLHRLAAAPALSPYAAALKHVALRGGKGALGQSARESELALARRGALPADYRPPPTTAWDDTIERWAYAWQFPVDENAEPLSAEIAQHPLLEDVRTVAQDLADVGLPSRAPRAAAESQPIREKLGLLATGAAVTAHIAAPSTSVTNADIAEQGAEAADSTLVPDVESPPPIMMPALQFQQQQLIPAGERMPVAYIDDGSDFALTSRRLGRVLVEGLGLPYDESGLTTVIAALGRARAPPSAVRALFDFAMAAGFQRTEPLYCAMMSGLARIADTSGCADLIEEMKEHGITPQRPTWTILMYAFDRARDYPAVIQVVDNMKALANIEPNETVFAFHLRALAFDRSRESNVFEAVQLFDQMENVYGFVPARRQYHALMMNLAQSVRPEMQLRLRESAHKMELLGIPWNAETYQILLRGAAITGDVGRARELCAKMRDEGVDVTEFHLSAAIGAYTNDMWKAARARFQTSPVLTPGVSSPSPGALSIDPTKRSELVQLLSKHLAVCYGVYGLMRTRGWDLTRTSADAMLRATTTATRVVATYLPDEGELMGRFEAQALKLWEEAYIDGASPDAETAPQKFGDDSVADATNDRMANRQLELRSRSRTSYECYISMLASQQRIDEAERVFQELTLRGLRHGPTRPTYEAMVLMHLLSGEEGGTHRALNYMQAMERAGHTVRVALVRRMRLATEQAAYRRDMKRRARRIIQAREEYLATKRQQEETGFEATTFGEEVVPVPPEADAARAVSTRGGAAAPTTTLAGESPAPTTTLTPLPIDERSALAWWDRWKRDSISKHELFETEADDGTPRGELFAEKNEALRKMGIESKFPSPHDLPSTTPRPTLDALRAENGHDPAASLFTLDGERSDQYPSGVGGADGWRAVLWRERQAVKAQIEKVRDGHEAPAPLSSAGNAVRPVGEQLLVERTGAATPGAIADALARPDLVYDDGRAKPATEVAPSVPASAELVWQREAADELGPFRDFDDNDDAGASSTAALAPENTATSALEREYLLKAEAATKAIQAKLEGHVAVMGGTETKRGKHDYLAKWREMYRHGSLEAPDEPLWNASDPATAKANVMRAWLDRRKKQE